MSLYEPKPLVNAKTDRLYLGTRDGMLMCLETIGSEWPLIHLPLPEEPQETPDDAQAPRRPGGQLPADAAGQGMDQDGPPDDDPFGGGFFDEEPPAADDEPVPFDVGGEEDGADDPADTGNEEDDPFDFDENPL